MDEAPLFVIITEEVVRNDARLMSLKGRRFPLRQYNARRKGRCVLSGQWFEPGAQIGYTKIVENGQVYYIEVLVESLAIQNKPSQPVKRSAQEYVRPSLSSNMLDYRIPDYRISEYQEQATRLFLTVFSNLILESRAGGGKTTMLKHLASFRSQNKAYIYLAFNTKNANEGRQKMPRGISSSTTHSFMGGVIDEHLRRGEQVLKKDWVIIDDLYPAMNNKNRKIIRRATVKMIGLAKAFAIHPGEIQCIRDIVEKYDFDLEANNKEEAIALCNEALQLSLPTSCYGAIWNYDDMLWWPVVLDMTLPHYHVALLDEVQDFNACQIWMAKKLVESGTRIVACGDPHQAIYRFRGASAEAFHDLCDLLQQSERGAERVVLPVSYRSSKSVIRYVVENTHVKDIVAHEDAPEGKVVLDMTYDEILDMLEAEENVDA